MNEFVEEHPAATGVAVGIALVAGLFIIDRVKQKRAAWRIKVARTIYEIESYLAEQ